MLITGAFGVHMLTRSTTPEAPEARPPTDARSLVVGDDRTVTMTNLDGGPATAALLDRVALQIGPAVAAVEDFWGTDWTRTIHIVGTGSAEQFAAQAGTGAAGRRDDTAAVAVADRVDPANRTVSGQRVVLAPGAADMSAEALRIVLGHELFHYAARADTAIDAPRWLTEGVADYVGRPAPVRPVSVDTSTLPTDADFAGTAAQLSAAYDRAWLFARFVADTHGPAALRELYVRACGADRVDVASALHDVLGVAPATLPDLWTQWAAHR